MMKVQCPECKAIFDMSEEKLSGKGTYVQCRQCRYEFPVQKEYPAGANALAKFGTFFLPVLLIVSLFCLLVFVFKISFVFLLPALIAAGLVLSLPFLVKSANLKGKKKD
jgi:predicted Zn finger-like uncharacterized protein